MFVRGTAHDDHRISARARRQRPEHEAVRVAVGPTQRALTGYVLSLVPNWSDADDIVQETSCGFGSSLAITIRAKILRMGQVHCPLSCVNVSQAVEPSELAISGTFVELVAAEAGTVAAEADLRHHHLADCLATLEIPAASCSSYVMRAICL